MTRERRGKARGLRYKERALEGKGGKLGLSEEERAFVELVTKPGGPPWNECLVQSGLWKRTSPPGASMEITYVREKVLRAVVAQYRAQEDLSWTMIIGRAKERIFEALDTLELEGAAGTKVINAAKVVMEAAIKGGMSLESEAEKKKRQGSLTDEQAAKNLLSAPEGEVVIGTTDGVGTLVTEGEGKAKLKDDSDPKVN